MPEKPSDPSIPEAEPVTGAESVSPTGQPFADDTSKTVPVDQRIAAQDLPQLPERIGGYRIVSVLGEGGMGRVYLAEDTRLKRRIALKVMRADLAANAQARERFLREARAVAAIEHDHVIGIFQVGEENGIPFLAMPLLKGETLETRLKRERGVPVPEAVRFAREMAEGLATAHESGLVHRDIKPANVWLEERTGRPPRVKILDFGLAHTGPGAGQLTASGLVMGTPAYMAPEQARGRTVDFRSDLFSLGSVIYQMLVGRRPFAGGDAMAMLTSLAVDTPTPPDQTNPAVPVALSAIVMRLLAKDPAGRPVSARAVSGELAALEWGWAATTATPVFEANPWSELESTDADEPTAEPLYEPEPNYGAPDQEAARPQRPRTSRWLQASIALLGLIVVAGAIGLVVKIRGKIIPSNTVPEGKIEPRDTKKPDDPDKKRQAEAEEALAVLEAKSKEPGVTFATFAVEVQSFKARFGAMPSALRATELLLKLPSPLDKLDPAKVPESHRSYLEALHSQLPLVAVLGEERGMHWAGVSGIVFTPDGRHVISLGFDGAMILWDARTRALERILHFDPAMPTASIDQPLAISPDGRWLAAAFADAKTCLFELTGTDVNPRKVFDSPPGCLAFSPDSKSLAYRGDSDCHLLDLTSSGLNKRSVVTANGLGAAGFAFSPDSQIIYRGAGDSVSICDRRQPDMAVRPRLTVPNESLWSLAASPKGGAVATAFASGRGSLWRLSGDKAEEIVLQPGGSMRTAFSPDGKLLAFGESVGDVSIWDVQAEKPKELKRWRAHAAHIYGIAFNPKDATLATAGADGAIRVWEVATGKEVQPSENLIGAATDVCWTPDAKELFVAYAGQSATLWDVGALKARHQFAGKPGPYVPHCAVSPDGKWLAAAFALADGGTLAVWNRESGALLRKPETGNPALMPSFSHDGRYLAAACGSSGTQVWNVDDGKQVFETPHVHNPVMCAFNPAAPMLAVGADAVRLYSVPRGREIQSAPLDAASSGSVHFHPNGKLLALGSQVFEHSPRLHRISGASGTIVDFSPDGRQMAAISGSTLSIHESTTGKLLDEWQFPGPVQNAAFAPDGRHIATANGNATVYILRVQEKPAPEIDLELAKRRQADGAKGLGVPLQVENSIGMKLNFIPAGSFLMGSPVSEAGRRAHEGPQHLVEFSKPFYLGIHEVTQAQYETIAKKNPAGTTTPDHPVHSISWDDAAAFCKALSELKAERDAGRTYRLPTEAEWEYACRAGTRTAFSFGNDHKQLAQHGWYNENDEGGATHPVGSKKPNPWGLFDMYGNLWEWCSDYYSPDYYRLSPRVDPKGPERTEFRVIRGGARANPWQEARSANRWPNQLPVAHGNVGFRVVLEVSSQAQPPKK